MGGAARFERVGCRFEPCLPNRRTLTGSSLDHMFDRWFVGGDCGAPLASPSTGAPAAALARSVQPLAGAARTMTDGVVSVDRPDGRVGAPRPHRRGTDVYAGFVAAGAMRARAWGGSSRLGGCVCVK